MPESATEKAIRSTVLIIEQHENSIRQAESELTTMRQRLLFIRNALSFLMLAKSTRKFVDETIVWRPGAILIAVLAMAGTGLAVFQSPLLGVLFGIPTALAMVFVLFIPTDTKSTEYVDSLNNEQSVLSAGIPGKVALRDELKGALDAASISLKSERIALKREQLAASHEHRRKMLLTENWKAMRSVEFEKYLERVFTELEYSVETTKVTGDQGVDLVIRSRGKRIAIQVKGYENSVSNGAVQEAYTGMAHYKCDAAAVITNSRFTRSATELANSIRCRLVDEDLLPNLVMGKVDLWSMCFGEDR